MKDLYFWTMNALILTFFGGVGMMIAWSKGRNRALGFGLGFVLGFIGWAILGLMKSRAPRGAPASPAV